MRVPLGWLKEYVDVDVTPAELREKLDMSGTKVEAVHEPAGPIEGIVVAEVLEVTPHPNADTLSLVQVTVGSGEVERVVCGAKNFAVGDRVAFARVGSRLPEMTITERKIRGEVSKGMLCSASELGISKDHSGLLVLPADAELGRDVVQVLALDDIVFELEVTPNRPDCMSIVGIAREVGALLDKELHVPKAGLTTVDIECPATVDVLDVKGCPRYLLRYIENVSVGPSPAWMAARLLAAGVRPISNVVDATNYVMIETGQPLHAFDADLVAEQAIVVRRAKEGERLKTLDGVERDLDPSDLLIADPVKPLGFAGIMGGEDSEVRPETSRLLLESATFDKVSVAFSSRRHGLRTEASARFERGSNPDAVPYAAARAARFICETAGAQTARREPDVYPHPPQRARVTLRPRRTSRLLGIDVPMDDQATRLRSIGLKVKERTERLEVEIPLFRPDLTREVDLIEEVARLLRFDRLPNTLPSGPAGGLDASAIAERTLRRILSGLGLHEIWTSSFMGREDLEKLALSEDHPAWQAVELENPMLDTETALRTTLMPALLKACAHNVAHRETDVALFEIARVYEPSDEKLPREALVLGAVFGGMRKPGDWQEPPEPWDFFGAKGVIEAAFESLGTRRPSAQPVGGMPFHPTRAAALTIGSSIAGAFGEVHPDVCARYDVPEGTLVCEISLGPVFAAVQEKVQLRELPRFPANYIDLALVVDAGVPAARVEELIWKAGAPEVTQVRIFDLYEGEQIPAGKKSLAYALELRVPDRTLTDEEAATVRDRIVLVLRERAGAELRT
ncbi:MAG: phenylalanyl-tRNA synthetase beta chain [Actinomycetota bacterium]|nr:phenylalanyl-tRNA synthetase beta chain [Actinomycetota bacterium]